MSHMLFRGVVGLSLLLSLGCSAMQQTIMRDNTGYKVCDKGRWNQVKSYDVDPTLRKMNVEQLRKFLAAGCKIRANKCSNGDYVLRSFVPGKGGGPFLGALVAVVGTVTTAAAALGAAAVVTATTLNPVAGAGAALVTVKVGMVATIYATGAAAGAPTP